METADMVKVAVSAAPSLPQQKAEGLPELKTEQY